MPSKLPMMTIMMPMMVTMMSMQIKMDTMSIDAAKIEKVMCNWLGDAMEREHSRKCSELNKR